MNEQTQVAVAQHEIDATPKGKVAVGNRGLVLSGLDDMWRWAQYVAKSGLAPKGMERPESIVVATQMGLEVGLTPMASLQNIAVINGRPTIWGDACLAIVRSTGELEEFCEWYEVKGQKTTRNPQDFGDDTAAVCRLKRRGFEAQESAFSVGDSKRAGLWGKQGPWSQYPARMLRFRARGFITRDAFGDALRGMLSTEEAMDIPIDVTPQTDVPYFDTAKPRVGRPPGTANKPKATEVAPEPTAPPTELPIDALTQEQESLYKAVMDAGGNWDLFQKSAIIEGWDGKAELWTGFGDVPSKLAAGLALLPNLKPSLDNRR